MKILVAEDNNVVKSLINNLLTQWGYVYDSVSNGKEALDIVSKYTLPFIALLDWMMPELDGLEVCKTIRTIHLTTPFFIILLTARNEKQDIVTGFKAGIDDYIIKPFDKDELMARIKVGERIIDLQQRLHERILKLEEAITHIKTLQGILPVCSSCHRIRNDQESWERIDKYISDHSDAQLSHTVCPECLKKLYPEYYLKT